MRKMLSLCAMLVFALTCLTLAGCAKSPIDLIKGDKKTSGQTAENQPTGGQPPVNQPSGNRDSGQEKPAGSLQGLVAKGMNLMETGIAFDYIMSGPGGTISQKMWVQGYKFKTEGAFGGEKMISIFDLEGKTLITYYPGKNEAVKLSADNPEVKAKPPGDYIKKTDFTRGQVLETTVYDGARCRVILLPEDNGGQTKMWIREDCGIPVRVETTAPGGGKTVTEYKNLQFGPLPTSTFELPPGVNITDINQMLEQLQKAPGSSR